MPVPILILVLVLGGAGGVFGWYKSEPKTKTKL
jgi:hypothetical protein